MDNNWMTAATSLFIVNGRRVPLAWIRPSRGRPYLRCPTCKAQVFAAVASGATELQIKFALGVNLTKHLKEFHVD